MGDAPSSTPPPSAAARSWRWSAWPRSAATRAAAPRPSRCCAAAWPSTPASSAPSCRSPRRCCVDDAEPDSVVAAVEELVAEVTPSVRFMLGTALYEGGHAGRRRDAVPRGRSPRQPDNAAVQVALAESLLSQSRWAEAVEAARPPTPAASRGPAAQSLLFGAIMGGDEAAFADGIERAGRAGVADRPGPGVRGLAHGARPAATPPRSLPLGAAPLLAHDPRGAAARRGVRRVREARPADGGLPAARPRAARAAGPDLPPPRLPGVGRRRVGRRLPGARARRPRAARPGPGRLRPRDARGRGHVRGRGAGARPRSRRAPRGCSRPSDPAV